MRTFWPFTASVFAGIAYVIRSVSPVPTFDPGVVDVKIGTGALPVCVPAPAVSVSAVSAGVALHAGAAPTPPDTSTDPAATSGSQLAPSVASVASRNRIEPDASAPSNRLLRIATSRFQFDGRSFVVSV